jgi:mannose-6-phosphate isomerase-like protein (cupin superfamily)
VNEPLSFLGREPPPGGRVRAVVLVPAGVVAYRVADWADALVVVERGTLEVECRNGVSARFGQGAVLTFAAVRPLRLRNPGAEPLVLSVLVRPAPPDR